MNSVKHMRTQQTSRLWYEMAGILIGSWLWQAFRVLFVSLKLIVPAGVGRPSPTPLSKTRKNKTPFTAHRWCGDEPGVSYPPRRRWRSCGRPDSSPAPAGRSVGWPPARSAPAALSPGGRSAGSGFAASGTGSCPGKRCSSASWRKEKRSDVEIQSPWHPCFAHDT